MINKVKLYQNYNKAINCRSKIAEKFKQNLITSIQFENLIIPLNEKIKQFEKLILITA